MASSSSKILRPDTKARARDKRCFCPEEKPMPFSPSTVSKPWGMVRTSASRCASARACHSSESLGWAPCGAATNRFSRTVPVKSQVCCETKADCSTKSTGLPLTLTVPPAGLKKPFNRCSKVVFP